MQQNNQPMTEDSEVGKVVLWDHFFLMLCIRLTEINIGQSISTMRILNNQCFMNIDMTQYIKALIQDLT